MYVLHARHVGYYNDASFSTHNIIKGRDSIIYQLNKYMLIIRHENVARLDDVCGMQEGEVVTRSGFEAPRRTLGDLQRSA